MKKLLILLCLLCAMAGSVTAYAENFETQDTISLGEKKVLTVPQPEGDINPGFVYFTHLFTFVPKEDGTYRFLVSYEQDENKPYDIFMDVVPFAYSDGGSKVYLDNNGYRNVKNGCEFDGQAGIAYELLFQYPIHDGRYPEFTFYVGTDDVEQVPKTSDNSLLLPASLMLTAAAAVIWLIDQRRKCI